MRRNSQRYRQWPQLQKAGVKVSFDETPLRKNCPAGGNARRPAVAFWRRSHMTTLSIRENGTEGADVAA